MRFASCKFRSKTGKLFFTFGLLIMVGIVAEILHIQGHMCSTNYSARRIHTLCNQYESKIISGNMCSKLCNDLQLTKCRGKRPGHGPAKHVALLKCTGCLVPGEVSRVIMKEGPGLPADLSSHFLTVNTTVEQALLLKRLIYSKSKLLFGVELSTELDIVRFILGEGISEQTKAVNSARTTSTILHQALTHAMIEEFLSLRVLGSKPFLPKLYGVCGSAYFVEYTPSLVTKWYILELVEDVINLNYRLPSWKERAELAIKFLDLILKMEDSFEPPMHMCDVKADNFGINTEGEISILDSDGIRFANAIPDIACTEDKFCSTDTCHGVCNRTTHRCLPYMVTTNLQTICARIFIGRLRGGGLLRGPPSGIRGFLSALLQECIQPHEKVFKLPANNKSDRRVLFALKSLLKRSIE